MQPRRNGGRVSDPKKEIRRAAFRILMGTIAGPLVGVGISLFSLYGCTNKIIGTMLISLGLFLLYSSSRKIGQPGLNNQRGNSAADGFRSVLLGISAAGIAFTFQAGEGSKHLQAIATCGFVVSVLVLLISWQMQKAKSFIRTENEHSRIKSHKFSILVHETWWLRNVVLDNIAMSSLLMSVVILLGQGVNN